MTSTERVGFVGVGNMGAALAGHLLDAGYQLTVFDLDQGAVDAIVKRGAVQSGSVGELAAGSDVIFTALPGPSQVRQVALGEGGILASARPGSVYVDLTTNSPEVSRECYEAGKARGVAVLDAAMSGGHHGAIAKRLTLMVGGDEDVAERLRPVLEAVSDNVVYCGGSGAGTVTKVVNNVLSLTESNLLAEALALGVRWGVRVETLAAVIGRSTGASWRLNESFPRYTLAGNFRPGFTVDLSVKDLELAKSLAGGVPAEFLELSLSRYQEAQRRGWNRQHSEAVVKLAEEKFGVRLRAHDAPDEDIVP